ncbi:unnamed protein product [Calypogeia fissa]
MLKTYVLNKAYLSPEQLLNPEALMKGSTTGQPLARAVTMQEASEAVALGTAGEKPVGHSDARSIGSAEGRITGQPPKKDGILESDLLLKLQLSRTASHVMRRSL